MIVITIACLNFGKANQCRAGAWQCRRRALAIDDWYKRKYFQGQRPYRAGTIRDTKATTATVQGHLARVDNAILTHEAANLIKEDGRVFEAMESGVQRSLRRMQWLHSALSSCAIRASH